MATTTSGDLRRLKIMYLYKILTEKTDENHHLTMPQIIAELAKYGIHAGRKALYEDIDALQFYGVDIIQVKGNESGYYVASRSFELPELKLLADAVTSAQFITEKKSKQILAKLGELCSVYEAKQLQRQVYMRNRIKNENEHIYISVDTIQRAIHEKKQIAFRYFGYNTAKRKQYRDGLRICSPYALTWDDGRYYLVAYYPKRPDSPTNFRVDRMENVEILDAPAAPTPQEFQLSEHLSASFSMFSGKTQLVTMRLKNHLVNPVIDRFGKQVALVPDDSEHFLLKVNVKAEQPFYGWIFQFGTDAEILEPQSVRDAFTAFLQTVMTQYGGGQNTL